MEEDYFSPCDNWQFFCQNKSTDLERELARSRHPEEIGGNVLKKMILMTVLTLVIMVSAFRMPMMVRASLTSVSVIQLSDVTHRDQITVSARLEERKKSDIQTDLPVVIKKMHVGLGDEVKVGDVLADVDVEKTKQSLLSLAGSYDAIPEEIRNMMALANPSEEQLKQLIPSKIVADYTGVISHLNLQEGAMSTPGEAVATITKKNNLQAVLSVPEEYGDQIAVGQSVSLSVSAIPGETFDGTIRQIAFSAYETLVGTSKQVVMNVYVDLAEQSKRLKSGYTALATVHLSDEKETWVLPYQAINQDDEGREYVYLYQQGQAVMRMIVTGKSLYEGQEILAGVGREDLVVAEQDLIKRNGQFITSSKIEQGARSDG